MINTMRNI